MSDTYTPDDQDGDMVSREHIRALEDKARRVDELAAEVENLKQQSIFTAALAGVDHPGLDYFRKGYSGEMTADAIRSAATEAGFLQTPAAAPPAPPAQTSELSQYGRIVEASTGATPVPTTDLTVGINSAQSVEEVMALMSSHIDPRTGQAFRTTWNTE